MLTFTQFLEGIRDKLGDYSGDPVQVMAARDVAEEDGLPEDSIDEWLLDPIIDQIELIKKEARERIKGPSVLYELIIWLDQMKSFLSSKPIDMRSAKSYLITFSRVVKQYIEDQVVLDSFNKLFDMFKNLRKKEVKNHFAGRGSDYELSKTLNQISNIVYAMTANDQELSNQYFDSYENIQDLRSFLKVGQANGNLSISLGCLSNTLRYGRDANMEKLFMDLGADRNFMKALSPILQSLVKKAASRMSRLPNR